MHVIVIGGGVVGVTTAWELQKDGHQVTLIEARQDVALETSFANGGQIAVTESAPWSRPGLVREFVSNVFSQTPYRLRLRADPMQWRWLFRFWRNTRPDVFQQAVVRNWRLAAYSLDCLQQNRRQIGNDFHYDDRQNGILQLIGADQNLAALQEQVAALAAQGAKVAWLEGADLAAQEPALAHAVTHGHVQAAIWGRADESGDAALFARKLSDMFERQGGRVMTDAAVSGFVLNKGAIVGLATTRGEVSGDGFVLCAGTASPSLAARLGERLTMVPVKGYSLTSMVLDAEKAPVTSLTDLSQRLVISRLGERMRVAGYAEIGVRAGINMRRIKAIRRRMQTLFPGAADYDAGEAWSGFRPMTPDGAPLVGPSRLYDNLWFNTGHGPLGWTFCHATARMTADTLKGRAPEIDVADFAPLR
ncbi:MAG: D-amino acid dehydrogenase [Parvibaculales bacterium]